MSEYSSSAGIWLPCARCGGKAFVGLDAGHRLALGCGACRAVVVIADPAALGLTAADVRRVCAPDFGSYVDGPSAPRGRPARVGPIYRAGPTNVAAGCPRSDDLPAVHVPVRGAA